MILSRRQFALSIMAVGCTGIRAPIAPSHVALWSWFDLPDDPRSHDLSGIVWEQSTRTAFAVQDKGSNIIGLVPDRELRQWEFRQTIHVQRSGRLDLEAITLLRDGFVVAGEAGPRLFEIDRAGRVRRDIPFPPELLEAVENKSLESVTATPGERYLFTTTECALPRDGPLATGSVGTRIRMVRINRATGTWTERMYVTDPAARDGAENGVSDLTALSDHELLVLERGWAQEVGNTVRIYLVDFALGNPRDDLAKSLIVDIGKLDVHALDLPKAREPQASPLLDNFEGLAVGPLLPDGRRSLLLVSDDNRRREQVGRVLVLAFT